jgi:hypothetical protein
MLVKPCETLDIPAERAEGAQVPLWLTKRGVLVRAAKPRRGADLG